MKDIGMGYWFFIRNLPPDATDESVAEFLASEFPITDGQISVRNYTGDSSAVISVDKDAVMYLLQRALLDRVFPGALRPVTFSPQGNRH
jgi:hypothetical protein